MPAAWDHKNVFLPVEGEVRRDERERSQRLRPLEEENRQLKHIVAEQAVDIRALKAVLAKKW